MKGERVLAIMAGQAAEVTATGSPFYGEQGTLASSMDAEGCVVVAFSRIVRIGDGDMAPVALHVRLPVDQLSIDQTPVVEATPPQEGIAEGTEAEHAPSSTESSEPATPEPAEA